MKVCPRCKQENELYREIENVTIFEDIFIDGVLENGDVDYTVAPPEISDSYEDDNAAFNTTYKCSYCQHVYSECTVNDVYFNEMIEKEG
jgi:hypothetical protein